MREVDNSSSAALGPGAVSRARESALRWRALASLFAAGGSIGAASLVLPIAAQANIGALWFNTGLAFASAAAMALLAWRLPMWGTHVALAAGTLVIARAVYYSGDSGSYYAIWYVWVALYAFSFYGRRAAFLHAGLVGLSYAAVLAWASSENAVARWLTTIATLLIAAAFVDKLVREQRKHAGAAQVSAARLGVAAHAMQRISRCGERCDVYTALRESVAEVTGVRAAAVVDDRPPCPATSAEVVVPLAADGSEATAWLVVELDPGESVEVRQAIDMLAGEAGNALTRIDLMTRLGAAARTDELTGLPNRRSWEEELARALAQARRFVMPVCVALLDLDGFKELNDSRGHQAGDELLRSAAQRWSAELRDVDTLVRWGGDEFALIVSGADLDVARETVDRVRSVTPGGITTSAGLVRWNGREDAAALMSRVDAVLYQAKRAGRDRTVAEGELAAPVS
jgi:diguanylate cyclase (GGDEF)-like protein